MPLGHFSQKKVPSPTGKNNGCVDRITCILQLFENCAPSEGFRVARQCRFPVLQAVVRYGKSNHQVIVQTGHGCVFVAVFSAVGTKKMPQKLAWKMRFRGECSGWESCLFLTMAGWVPPPLPSLKTGHIGPNTHPPMPWDRS